MESFINNTHPLLKTNDCCACAACIDTCPTNAISFTLNEYGEEHIKIDESKCVRCGKCEKVCQQYNQAPLNKTIDCYGYQSKDILNAKNQFSASGGLVYDIEKIILAKDGVVAGTVFNSKYNCVFEFIESTNDLYLFSGSKYVHSDARTIYKRTIDYLKDGRTVLFTGLPCQVHAMKLFVNCYSSKLLEKLYLIDLVCHGTPPSSYFKKYIEEKKYNNCSNVRFRGLKNDFHLSLYNGDNLKDSIPASSDYYYSAFLNSVIYRNNCYSCNFAQLKRAGDITAGDFWGIENTETALRGKVSLCLVNTEKGKTLFDEIKECGLCEKHKVEEAIRYNAQLRTPAPLTDDVMLFKKSFSKDGFIKSFLKTQFGKKMCYDLKKKKRHKFIYKVRKLIIWKK